MLVYSGTKKEFDKDVRTNRLVTKIERAFFQRGLTREGTSELHAWKNSLGKMQEVLNNSCFSDDILCRFVVVLINTLVIFLFVYLFIFAILY